jgi:hypothetical protein
MGAVEVIAGPATLWSVRRIVAGRVLLRSGEQ